ncbi:MAG TPA: type IV pili methyl-accepting chemotaxis transducer N-terminal domain-containing protein, partial [Burkholderiales bacterium]|nr:type IV pili methyl-accepting chemotaxis transducer N-terminal domain-containing protein [Burkholderiales bacterium]
MAFKLALKLPFRGRPDEKAAAKAPAAPAASKPLPLIGRLSTARQLQILTSALVLFLVVDAAIVAYDTRQSTFDTVYIASAGKLRMLSQRLAKAAQQASEGNREAFKQLRESRDEFASIVKLLTEGGTSGTVTLPPTPDEVKPALDALAKEWSKTERNASTVISQERSLVGLGQSVRNINANNPTLLELADEIDADLQASGNARQNGASGQLVMLTQRMAKNANAILAANIVDPEVAFLLGKDTNTFRSLLQALLQGSDAMRMGRVTDAEVRGKLGELEVAFREYQNGVSAILGNMQGLGHAKRATRDIFNDSEALLKSAEELNSGYEGLVASRQLTIVALAVVSVLAFIVLLLIGKVYIDDGRRRAEESEQTNRQNQEAILRLLDEISNVANGDLTARARVTEDITGAIADSINFTIDELRRLVAGITEAANQVTSATQEANTVSSQLLQATQKQAGEIQGAGQSVTQMAQLMTDISAKANDSAKVAQTSLNAAEKGTQAVQNAIKGMNEIRDQIQETSKRIKRLGESSQEIGEIVQLISDITEQTNVLALNAAIQAASAGEATKHISAIVKSIQRDTQDAVAAMELSTQGVVQGTKTADEADQAL